MNTQPKRKPNSIFDEQVKAINSYKVGDIYKVKDLRNRMNVGRNNTDRVGDYHLDLLSTKCIERVKRGQYRVLGWIPDFLTLNMCEANRGYTTYGPNPKYIGKSEKYGEQGHYDEWYINGERPRIEVPRGKTWKLGESNPHSDYKAFSENNKESEEKKEEVKPETSININEASRRISNLLAEGKRVEAFTRFENRPIIILAILTDQPGVIKFMYKDTSEVSHMAIVSIVDLKISETPIHPNIKHNLIVEILKQGLSAADAATEILKLI
jgi:hypothetical protein